MKVFKNLELMVLSLMEDHSSSQVVQILSQVAQIFPKTQINYNNKLLNNIFIMIQNVWLNKQLTCWNEIKTNI